MDRGFYPSMLSHCLYVNPAKPFANVASDNDMLLSNQDIPACLNTFSSAVLPRSQPSLTNHLSDPNTIKNDSIINHQLSAHPLQKRSFDDIYCPNNISSPLPDNHQPHQKRIKGQY
ncbi:hypothetical protein BB561_002461 [Smittium simulii]|uniref:Uncharacterized protein n=1 Tax=Smittium simulii TaxID=133385 RepID=A0A2T9YQC7_9FUNG|nr:hypothetical protein BB561_002461 [Smittium simulii]